MKVWLTQTVLSPYRIELFRRLAEAPGVDFSLVLLSDRFKVRPQWKRDLSSLPFRVVVPWGFSLRTGPEKEFCVNPLLVFKILAERPDVIICGGYSLATIAAWLASLVSSCRYIIWTEATMHTDGHLSGVRLWLRRLLARRAAAFIDAGTLARQYVQHLLPDLEPGRLFRAFNCVDNSLFRRARGGPRDLFDARGLPARNLVFVGKLNERKGIPALLEAYRLVAAQSDPHPGLILIGEGPEKERIERFRQEHHLPQIRMEGWLENEKTARYYALADVFVLLSSVDHNPLVLFEALAAGIPIICSRGACNAIDFIRDGVNGYIVDPANPPAVAARILEVLHWDDARREACTRCSHELVDRANYDDAARAFLDACRTAVRPPSGPQPHTPRP